LDVEWLDTFVPSKFRLCKSAGLYGGSEPESGGLSGKCVCVPPPATPVTPAVGAGPPAQCINASICPKSNASLSIPPIKSERAKNKQIMTFYFKFVF